MKGLAEEGKGGRKSGGFISKGEKNDLFGGKGG